MKKNTRFAFNAYLQQLARLNGVAVEELSSKFTVEPSVQQTLEDQIQQSAAFLTLINVTPVTGETPGTFRLDIGVQDQGITEDTYLELERLISDAKPCSRHMIGMSINLQTSGPHWVGAASYLGEEITIYPYINETIISGGTAHEGGAVHVIDTMRVNP